MGISPSPPAPPYPINTPHSVYFHSYHTRLLVYVRSQPCSATWCTCVADAVPGTCTSCYDVRQCFHNWLERILCFDSHAVSPLRNACCTVRPLDMFRASRRTICGHSVLRCCTGQRTLNRLPALVVRFSILPCCTLLFLLHRLSRGWTSLRCTSAPCRVALQCMFDSKASSGICSHRSMPSSIGSHILLAELLFGACQPLPHRCWCNAQHVCDFLARVPIHTVQQQWFT